MAVSLSGTNKIDMGNGFPVVITTGGLTVAITLRVTGTPANGARIVERWGSDGLLQQAFVVAHNFTGQIFFGVRENVSFDHSYYQTTTTGLVVNGALLRIVARFTLGGTPQIWLNGVQQAMSLVDASGTVDNISSPGVSLEIGYESNEGVNAVPGDYSEYALWTEVVPDWVCEAYGKGLSPRAYRTANSKQYLPMVNTSTFVDEWSGFVGTNTGGTSAPHPSMYLPMGSQ